GRPRQCSGVARHLAAAVGTRSQTSHLQAPWPGRESDRRSGNACRSSAEASGMKLYRVWLLAGILVADAEAGPRHTVPVPMRDGVRLATDIYGDPTARKPVLLARTPYDKAGLRARAEQYVRSGYAVVIQDCRGRYASEGAYMPYNNDAQDGYDTLEWIHRQPWCDGRTAMFGGSHLALVQWLAATGQ